MDASLKIEIKNAIVIGIIAVVIGLVVNTARTPLLNQLVAKGVVRSATADKLLGVNLIDDWSHKGWPNSEGSTEPADGGERISWGRIPFVDAKSLFESGEALFFDARVPEEYAKGHIKGARSLPFNDFYAYFDRYSAGLPLDARIVIYCEGGDCDQSKAVADGLVVEKYTDVDIYEGGYEEWAGLNMPIESGGGE